MPFPRQTATLLVLIALPSSVMAQFSSNTTTIEGFTEPYRLVEISISEPGVVTEVNVQPGQLVKSGESLVILDTSVLRATLAVAKQRAVGTGGTDAAIAEYELRKERLNQITLLRQRGHATQHEYNRAVADVNIARAKWKLNKEEQKLSELDCHRIEAQIARRKAVSPFTGVVAEVHREVGESVAITAPQVATVVQLDKLRTRFSATPEQAQNLRGNQSVELTLAGSDTRVPAKIERISPIVDAKSGTIEIHVVIENSDFALRSGVRCLMEVGESQSANSLANSK